MSDLNSTWIYYRAIEAERERYAMALKWARELRQLEKREPIAPQRRRDRPRWRLAVRQRREA